MFDSNDQLVLEYFDGRYWRLHEEFGYFDDHDDAGPDGAWIDVPAGFWTDFASIPRFMWAVLPPTGKYGKAAVIHDWLYYSGKVEGEPISRQYADQVFKRAMQDLGVAAPRRAAMYAAVRLFGGRIWSRQRELR